jgi:hypothetical protein
MLCAALMAPAAQVCMVAGELMAIGLVMPLTQATGSFNAIPPQPARHTGQFSRVQYASAPAWPPQSGMSAPMPVVAPMATQAQWGNGATGATFAMGNWMVSSQQAVSQPVAAYAPAGSYR